RGSSGRGCKYDWIGRVEVRVVQDVEKLAAELQVQPLPDWDTLRERQVERIEPRPFQYVASGVSVGTGKRNDERRRIVVLARISGDHVPGECGIPRRPNRIAGVAIVARVETELRRERQSGLRSDNRARLPPGDKPVYPRITALVPNRQVVGHVDRRAVPYVEEHTSELQ